jgi:PAS domain S-box-containing protein
MKQILQSLISSLRDDKEKEQIAIDTQNQKIANSYKALISAADDTLLLAQDVTIGLRNKIDDISKQIDATSLVIEDALLVVSDDGTVENANSAALKIFGYTKEEMTGKTIASLFSNMGHGGISISRFKKTFKTDVNIFERIRKGKFDIFGITKNGSTFYPNIRISTFDSSDGKTRFMLLVQDITDVIVSERRISEMHKQQEATLKAMPDILCVISKDYKLIQLYNNGTITNYDPNKVVGKHIAEFLSNTNYELFVKNISNIIPNTVNTWNYEIEHPTVGVRYREARATNCGDNILVIVRDITDNILTKEELAETEEHFNMFGEASSEAMVIHNDTEILKWNDKLVEMTGFNEDEIKSKAILDFIKPIGKVSEILNNEQTYTTLIQNKNGTIIKIAVTEREVEWDNTPAKIKVIRDISNLIDHTNLLELPRDLPTPAIDNSYDVVVCYDKTLAIMYVNQTFMDYFGDEYKPGMNLDNFIDARDHKSLEQHLSQINIHEPVKRTLHRVKFNGSTRWLDWIDRAIFDKQGNITEYQGVGRDVTDYIKKLKESK